MPEDFDNQSHQFMVDFEFKHGNTIFASQIFQSLHRSARCLKFLELLKEDLCRIHPPSVFVNDIDGEVRDFFGCQSVEQRQYRACTEWSGSTFV